MSDFAVFILSNRRPDNVFTYDTLRKQGYTGRIVILVDDLDDTRDRYVEKYGNQVEIFDKREAAKTTDSGDNFQSLNCVLFARNATFSVAKRLGVKYFIQLDDDYRHFQFRFNRNLNYRPRAVQSLDKIFAALLRFLKSTPIASIALSQGGDFIGGEESKMASHIFMKRKCMNSFVCSVDRPFKFFGSINEDTSAYARLGNTGSIFFTVNQVSLEQTQTQSQAGGLTEIYLELGTYVKSFYSVMFQPSSVKVKILKDRNASRLHHSISWVNTVPMILRESARNKVSV